MCDVSTNVFLEVPYIERKSITTQRTIDSVIWLARLIKKPMMPNAVSVCGRTKLVAL